MGFGVKFTSILLGMMLIQTMLMMLQSFWNEFHNFYFFLITALKIFDEYNVIQQIKEVLP